MLRKAMILAAGRGERLRPLTDLIPKPLVKLRGRCLIDYHLQHLAEIGIEEVVINVSYLAEKIMEHVGDGSSYGLRVKFSLEEGEPLGTGGGIFKALPLLGEKPFILLSADIWGDYPLSRLPQILTGQLYLVLIPTPFNYAGDFYLHGIKISEESPPEKKCFPPALTLREKKLTYGGIAVVNPGIFKNGESGKSSLNPYFRQAIAAGKATGECYHGQLFNITSLEQLYELEPNSFSQ